MIPSSVIFGWIDWQAIFDVDWQTLFNQDSLTHYDHAVIVFYLAFMIAIGWVVRRFNQSSSDYFRGSGNMLWWMTGSSAFMVAFSAVLFTGVAGKAYLDGSIVLVIYICLLYTSPSPRDRG